MHTQESDAIEETGQTSQLGSVWEVLAVFTRLGLTSFGGPVAHLGYFREDIIIRRKWVDERTYGDLIGLCQFLPGRPVARSASPSASCARGYRVGWPPGWASRCPPPS